VLVAITLGILLGVADPARAEAMRPLGDGFIRLVKMLIGPIIFCTITIGIANMGHMREVGRIGLAAMIYFETVSGFALVLGLLVVNLLQPGAGLTITASEADLKAAAGYGATAASQSDTFAGFLLNIIPTTVVDAFARGEILQVLLVSALFGFALLSLGKRVRPLVTLIEQLSHVLFAIVGLIMRLAPLGAFGAMAFTIGRYGISSLLVLGQLMAGVYLTCLVFIVVVLGFILRWCGLRLMPLLRYLSEELLIVLGTSSSESAFPRLMMKLERLGCSKPVVGLVLPAGYSFNLDGTAIYMTMAAIFVAQVSGVHLTPGDQLSVLAVLMVTSNGAAGVVGSGFITLAATLATIPSIPPAGLALLVGVDRFMAEARSITNFIGNAVATVAIAKWGDALDLPRAQQVLAGTPPHQDQVDGGAQPKRHEPRVGVEVVE